MPIYKYNAISLDGTKSSGKAEAASETQLSSILNGEGLFLLKSTVSESITKQAKLKTVEIADFCRQLAAMLSSGITLIRSMQIIAQRDAKPHVKKVYTALIEELQRGSSLSESMAHQGRAFPELLINMTRAGESNGRMDVTALKMANHYDKQHRLDGKIKSATTYPIILVVLIVLVMVVIFTFVLPTFFDMFEGMVLPLPTRVVLALSTFLTHNFLLIAVVVVIAVAVITYTFRQPKPKLFLDMVKLKIPKIGKLLSTIYTARFARTLASLYVSGIPMIQALTICRRTIGNKYIESQFDEVISALGNGRTLSQSLASVKGFENKLLSTILIGEESGRLEQMLDAVADQFDYDSEMASQRLVTMIEPVLIVVMAVVVGFVIVSVMLPIYQMYSTVGEMGGGM
ncbi:MAG: type II secretion system F family protein [Clostridiales Family XIII bacterium]|jgi:type IV pilus assembly protein PilC|nr:type II secretion system F family protein [Clostridiales Family XIII bacterium]